MDDRLLSVLWEDFEINLGRFLLSLWRNFRNGLRLVEPDGSTTLSLQDVFDREIERRRQSVYPGYTTQEVVDGLCLMVSARSIVRDYQPEQCSFTQYNDDGFAFPMPVEEVK